MIVHGTRHWWNVLCWLRTLPLPLSRPQLQPLGKNPANAVRFDTGRTDTVLMPGKKEPKDLATGDLGEAVETLSGGLLFASSPPALLAWPRRAHAPGSRACAGRRTSCVGPQNSDRTSGRARAQAIQTGAYESSQLGAKKWQWRPKCRRM